MINNLKKETKTIVIKINTYWNSKPLKKKGVTKTLWVEKYNNSMAKIFVINSQSQADFKAFKVDQQSQADILIEAIS